MSIDDRFDKARDELRRDAEFAIARDAARQASRGITLAWCAIGLNLLLAALAIGIPYVQRGWEQDDQIALYAEAKDLILMEARSVIVEIEDGYFDLKSIGEALLAMENRGVEQRVRDTISRIEAIAVETTDRFEHYDLNASLHIALSNVLIGNRLMLDALRSVAWAMSGREANGEVAFRGQIEGAITTYQKYGDAAVRDLMLMIALNTDGSGVPLPGPIIIRRCRHTVFDERCTEMRTRLKPVPTAVAD